MSAGDRGGGPDGPVYAVTLVRFQAPPADGASAAAQAATPLRMKLRNIDTDRGPFVPSERERSAFASLAERLSQADRSPASPQPRSEATRVQPQGSPLPDAVRLSQARSRTTRTDLDADGQAVGELSTGSLWGAIEPCWRNLGFRGQVPVSIEVALNGRGGLAGPPTVLRSASALLSEPRLKSEANALAALSACLPRDGEIRIAAGKQRLDFPGTN